MKTILAVAGVCLLAVGCSNPPPPAPRSVVTTTTGPAANPTGSNLPSSGQPSNTMGGVTSIQRGPALDPTGSNTPRSGAASNMDVNASSGASTAPPKRETGSVKYQNSGY